MSVAKICGIAAADIAAVNGVAAASIAAVDGVPFSAAAAGLLDSYTTNLQHAWGLRKMRSTATLCLKVHSSAGGTDQDIGFTGAAVNDSAITAHVGANTGTVDTLYDQVGSLNFAQSTVGAQPRIVNAGAYDGQLVFDGTADGMLTGSNYAGGNTGITVFMRLTRRSTAATHAFMELSDSGNTGTRKTFLIYGTNTPRLCLRSRDNGTSGNRERQYSETPAIADVYAFRIDGTFTTSADRCRVWKNGTELTSSGTNDSGTIGGTTLDAFPLYLGARGVASLFAPIDLDTVAIYGAALSTTDIPNICTALA